MTYITNVLRDYMAKIISSTEIQLYVESLLYVEIMAFSQHLKCTKVQNKC